MRSLSWDEIIDHCSRLHTTRTREMYPGGQLREGSEMLNVFVEGRPAVIVPTRMHEPGFYWRYEDTPMGEGIMRSEDDIALLCRLADLGKVTLGLVGDAR